MSEWTLGQIKARNMEILALCEGEGCGHLGIFNLDQLIEGVGEDFALADAPPMSCPRCGQPLAIRLSFADPLPEEETP
jgi:hypothetical protein